MFCRVKCNNKDFKDDTVYKFYLCERKRVDGKVKSKDIHIVDFDYYDIVNIRVKVLTKVMNIGLKNKGLYSEDNSDLIFDKILDLREKLLEEERKFQEEKERIYREQARKRAEEEERQRRDYEEVFKNYNKNCSGSSIGVVNDTTKEFMIEIIKVGYKKLASKYHPDKGGKHEDMQRLNKAKEELDKIIN